jgi:hypothetical protein
MFQRLIATVFCIILSVSASLAYADKQARSVETFSRVEINGPFDASVSIGTTPSLTVNGDAAILPWVISSVKDGQLVVSIRSGIRPHYAARVALTITAPKLATLIGNNHAQLQIKELKADKLTVGLDNHSSLTATDMQIKQSTVITLNNHSRVSIDGTTQQFILNGGNHSVIKADDYEAKSASVTLSNHSRAKLSSQTVITNESNHSSLKLSQGLHKISGHLQDHSNVDAPKSEAIQTVLSNDSEYGLG